MTKTTQKLINELCDAAKAWGWQQDQGVGSSVKNSEEGYLAAKKRLEDHIERILPRRQKSKEPVEPKAPQRRRPGLPPIRVGKAMYGGRPCGGELGGVLDG